MKVAASTPTRQTAFDYDRTVVAFEGAHIQLSVREPSNILAAWSVKKDGRYGKDDS